MPHTNYRLQSFRNGGAVGRTMVVFHAPQTCQGFSSMTTTPLLQLKGFNDEKKPGRRHTFDF